MSYPYDASPEKRPKRWLRYGLPALVILSGLLIAAWLMNTGPKAKKKPRERIPPLVQVREVQFSTERTRVVAMGTVRSSREVQLTPEVGGRIQSLGPEFLPGGLVRKGGLLLQIDPADYQLAVKQLDGEVSKAQSELRLEEGKQLVAQKEYELFGEQVSEGEQRLMLRQPQLDSLRAALESSRSRLEQARLNLERTRVTAPFNALVVSRDVDLGAHVNTSKTLGWLVSSDAFWIEVSVPVSQLRWIDIPQKSGDPGAAVKIYDEAAWGTGRYREGKVIRLAAGLEEKGRMARLLVEVNDPLALSKKKEASPRMLLDAYVRVEIEGRELDQVAALKRSELRDGDTAWVLNGENKLEIRKLEIPFRGDENVLVTKGLDAGDLLITSGLSTPVEGMSLRTSEERNSKDGTR